MQSLQSPAAHHKFTDVTESSFAKDCSLARYDPDRNTDHPRIVMYCSLTRDTNSRSGSWEEVTSETSGHLNKRTSWGWWDKSDDTILQTQDSNKDIIK